MKVNIRFMVSLSPFIVEIETALRSQNRKSLVFNNKAVFIKFCCFHFPILKLNLNTLTNVYVGRPCFMLGWLFLYLVSKQQSHRAFQGIYKSQCYFNEIWNTLQKPKTRWHQLLWEAYSEYRLPSADTDWDPPHWLTLLQSVFRLQFWDHSGHSALALVLDWDLSANSQANHAVSIYNIFYISYKRNTYSFICISISFFACNNYLLKPFRVTIPMKKHNQTKKCWASRPLPENQHGHCNC